MSDPAARCLYLDPQLDPRSLLSPDRACITATRTLAQQLDRRHVSPEQLAAETLKLRGIAVVSPWLARQLLVEAVADVMPDSDAVAVAQWLSGALRSLLKSGADLRELANVSGLAPKVYRTIAIATNYRAKLARRSLVDPAELFWRAIATEPDRQRLAVVGSIDPDGDRLAFLDAIAGDGSRLALPCDGSDWFHETRSAVKTLQSQGWQVFWSPDDTEEIRDLATLVPIISTIGTTGATAKRGENSADRASIFPREYREYVAYADSDSEIRSVLATVKQRVADGAPTDTIAIVARANSDYARQIGDIAWEFGLPVRQTRSPSLAATRLGSWMRCFLEVWQRNFTFEATASLLQHPLTPAKFAPPQSVARLRRPDNRQAWESIGAQFPAIESWRKARRSTWVDRLEGVLAAWDIEARCGLWPEEAIAFERLRDAFDELANFDDAQRSGDRFARELETLLGSQPVEIAGRGGVAIHSPESIVGSRYDTVFVLGAIEGAYPEPVRNDTAIDFFTRKQLARAGFDLGSAMRSARQETRLFDGLLRVASRRLTLSYPRAIGKTTTLPSAYLGQFEIPERLPMPVREAAPTASPTANSIANPIATPIASLERARRTWLRSPQLPDAAQPDRVLTHARRCQRVELDRETSAGYSIYDGLTDLPEDAADRLFSASQLSMLGQCGFKWFARYGLRASRPREKENKLDGRLKGQLYHQALDGAMREIVGCEDPRDRVLDSLDGAFATAEQALSLERLPAWKVQRREHLALLRRTIENESFFTPGGVVVALEKEFRGEWNGFTVTGKIDRADETPDGIALVEYKTRSSAPTQAQNSQGDAKFDVQLQLYVEAAGADLFPDRTIARAHYYSLTKAKRLKEMNATDDVEAAAFADRLRDYLARGAYAVQPDRGQKVCEFCDCDAICRKGARLKRKRRSASDS